MTDMADRELLEMAAKDWRAGFAAGLAARDGDGFFPRSSSTDREAGWTLEFSFLKTIADTTAEMDDDFSVSMEQAELILLAVEQLGYRVKPAPINSPVVSAEPSPTLQDMITAAQKDAQTWPQWAQHNAHIATAEPSATEGAGELAQLFHDTYERLAPQFGYETRPDTKSFDPASPNGRLMTAVCAEIRQHFTEGAAQSQEPVAFQQRVQPWLMACFGAEISSDAEERNHRLIEEALELVQSCGATDSECHQLVDYVYGRPVGEKSQEVGGVMVTLAALCLAQGLDMHACGETELTRIWGKVEQIRAKQAAKPKHSPLPAHPLADRPEGWKNNG